MTFSRDGKKLCYDAMVGKKFYFGEIDIEKGEFIPTPKHKKLAKLVKECGLLIE